MYYYLFPRDGPPLIIWMDELILGEEDIAEVLDYLSAPFYMFVFRTEVEPMEYQLTLLRENSMERARARRGGKLSELEAG